MADAVDGSEVAIPNVVDIDEAVEILALWLGDQRIPPADVRRAGLQLIGAWHEMTTSLAATIQGDGSLDEVAATMAAMRGNAAIPRVVRMSQGERARAYGYLIALVTGLDGELRLREADYPSLERMLGLRSGRSGGLAEAAEVGLDSRDVAMIRPDMDATRRILCSSDDELEHARLLAQLLVDWMPVLAPVLLAEFGAKGRAFEELVRGALTDPPPTLIALLAVGLIGALAVSGPEPVELRRRQDELASGSVDLELLELLPRGDRQRVIDHLPLRRRKRIEAEVRRRVSTSRSLKP